MNLLVRPVSATLHVREDEDVTAHRHDGSIQISPTGATGSNALLGLAWLVVGLPLLYGLVQTLSKVAPLFGG